MQNLPKQNDMPFDLAHFQVEELEERLENKWEETPSGPGTPYPQDAPRTPTLKIPL